MKNLHPFHTSREIFTELFTVSERSQHSAVSAGTSAPCPEHHNDCLRSWRTFEPRFAELPILRKESLQWTLPPSSSLLRGARCRAQSAMVISTHSHGQSLTREFARSRLHRIRPPYNTNRQLLLRTGALRPTAVGENHSVALGERAGRTFLSAPRYLRIRSTEAGGVFRPGRSLTGAEDGRALAFIGRSSERGRREGAGILFRRAYVEHWRLALPESIGRLRGISFIRYLTPSSPPENFRGKRICRWKVSVAISNPGK